MTFFGSESSNHAQSYVDFWEGDGRAMGGRCYAHVVSGALSNLINQNAARFVCVAVVNEERARQFV